MQSPYVTFVYLPTPLAWISKLPKPLFILLSPVKVLLGALILAWTLLNKIGQTPAYMLIQVSFLQHTQIQ